MCREAYIQASIFSGIAQTCALIGAPLFGFLIDYTRSVHSTHKIICILISSSFAFIGYYSLYFSHPIHSSFLTILILMILIGLGEIGMVVSNLALVTESSSVASNSRGSVAGVSSACGALGILVISKLGGILFDGWNQGAPFLIVAVGHVIVICIAGYVILSNIYTK